MIKNILITGGNGYIGSHLCIKLLQLGFNITIVDNLVNSKLSNLKKIRKISKKKFYFYKLDIQKTKKLTQILKDRKINFVFHLAALKAVNESVLFPIRYYKNNILGNSSLINSMINAKVFKIVFSSSAVVYGNTIKFPINEKTNPNPLSPYGLTKLFCEQQFSYLSSANKKWKIISLRYFNPVGSHDSSEIGDNPDKPDNIMPVINKTALGKKKFFEIYGKKYPTRDGTAIRDYIHVMDVVDAHITCLRKINKFTGHEIFNIGTGKGISVLQLLRSYEKINNLVLKKKFGPNRDGDIPISYADVKKIQKKLKWESKHDLLDMCKSSFLFAKKTNL